MINKNPLYIEVDGWDNQKLLEFLRFCAFQIDMVKTGHHHKIDEAFHLTDEKFKQLQEIQDKLEHPWQPFTEHCDFKSKTIKEGLNRTRNYCPHILKYLRDRPLRITEEMKEVMESKPKKMGFALSKYFSKLQTVDGKVVPITLEDRKNRVLEDTIIVLQRAIDYAKNNKMNEMTVKETLTVIPKLIDSIMKMSGSKNRIPNLTQINITGNAREMEESMLNFVKQRDEDN